MMRSSRIDWLPAVLLALLGCQRAPAPTALDLHRQPAAAVRPTDASPSSPMEAGAPDEPTTTAKSRLQIETWEFGTIAPGTELHHRYTIKNTSPSTWTIKEVTPSCSCTCGEFTSRTVRPADSTSVEVVFRAGNRDGEVYQAILVEFAQTQAPIVQLAMKGEVRGLLSPSPPTVDFGRVWAATRGLSRSIQLRNYSEQDITITKIEAPHWLQAEAQPAERVEPGSRPRQQWTITVHADLDKFEVGQESVLVVHTNAGKMERVLIPVRLEIRSALEVVPHTLDFRTVPVGRKSQQALLLDVAQELGELSEKDFALTHNLGDELEIQILKTPAPNRFRLIGIFQPKRATDAVHGELQINVRSRSAASVRVPISAVIR